MYGENPYPHIIEKLKRKTKICLKILVIDFDNMNKCEIDGVTV